MVLALPVWQGLLAVAVASLPFVEKDGQRAQQRQIPRGHGMTNLAMVFALGVVPPIVLADFDAPIIPHQRQHLVRTGLLGGQTEHAIAGLARGLDDLPSAQKIHLLVEPKDLRRSGQAEGRPIHGLTSELAKFHPAMAFIAGLSLRGENRPPGAVGL